VTIARINIKDEKELRKIVADDVSVVERELTVICSTMPIDTKSNVDVLCHDENGQLVILKLSTKENDNIFFEGLKILAYVNNVKPMLKFSYKDFKIDDAKTPRLVFLAPSFSPQFVDVAGQMQGIRMDLYTWEYFEFDDKKALHLEPVWLSETTKSKPRTTKPKKPEPEITAEKKPSKLVDEVIMPPEEVQLGSSKKDNREQAEKKSIFSI